MSSVIVRYSEIGLKGKNRIVFEKKLMNNIRSCLDRNQIAFSSIKNPRGRILISGIKFCRPLNCVFGIGSFSETVNAGFNMEEIKKTALNLIKDKLKNKSFCVSCQRLDKSFPVNSMEFAKELGLFIQDKTKAQVNLKKPDITIYAEIIDGMVYLFTEKIKGLGGLPLGIEGNVIVKTDDESSLLSAILMMKRGCDVFCVGKKKFDIGLLRKFNYGSKINLKILKTYNEMNAFAREKHSKGFIVSDTFNSVEKYKFELPVFRPLSAFSKEQIKERLDGFRERVCKAV
ncbi:hypothetical protein GF358_00705 [Candidatus Woesearchaeota archaeon]|nr:hypothetical protein [Candidatus Woesearchaeota archaeon]